MVITGRDEARLKQTQKECKNPDKVKYYVLDMDKPDFVFDWCTKKSDEIGTLDVLIHNAGFSMRDKLLNTEIEIGQKLLNVDFLSLFSMTKALIGNMNTKEQGSVICAVGKSSPKFLL